MEAHIGMGAAASLGVGSLGLELGAMVGPVLLLELGLCVESQRHRSQLD